MIEEGGGIAADKTASDGITKGDTDGASIGFGFAKTAKVPKLKAVPSTDNDVSNDLIEGNMVLSGLE